MEMLQGKDLIFNYKASWGMSQLSSSGLWTKSITKKLQSKVILNATFFNHLLLLYSDRYANDLQTDSVCLTINEVFF